MYLQPDPVGPYPEDPPGAGGGAEQPGEEAGGGGRGGGGGPGGGGRKTTLNSLNVILLYWDQNSNSKQYDMCYKQLRVSSVI